MSRRQSSIPARYFDELYAGERDPWEFETSAYEQAKYDATLAALPRPLYRRGLEIGCSIGVLTARLAGRCASLVAGGGLGEKAPPGANGVRGASQSRLR